MLRTDESTSASENAGQMNFPSQACVRMFEVHPDAHWLLDERGVLQHANRAALHLMGNLAQVPVGENIANLVADGPSHCADLIRQGMRSSVPTPARLRLRTRDAAEVARRCEIALLTPASEGAPALLWCRFLEQGLGKNQFEVLNQQIQSLKREVGRRQAAESDMRQQSEWLETVLLGIAEGVIATDLDGCVLFMNQVAAELTGWPRALSMGRMVTDVVQLIALDGSGSRKDVVANLGQLSGLDPTQRRLQLVDRGGATRLVQVSLSPLTSEFGVRRGTVLVLRSVEDEVKAERERLALEHQLRESQKMEALGTMAGGIAHDFNNIVAAILGNVELALEDLTPESEGRVSLLEIRKAARRARDMVQQILTFSRRQDNTRAPVAVQTLLQEAQSMLKAALQPEAQLEIHADEHLPPIWANATQIEQVFLNLTGNAMQALQGRASGKVEVQVRRFDGRPAPSDPDEYEVISIGPEWPETSLRIQVSDNGSGMDPPTLARIFEPFFTTKAIGSGTGLGLAVVHGILRDHQAVLRVRSAPGAGTMFTIWLPGMIESAVQSQVVPDTPAAMASSSAGGDPAAHVLYVDDDESMAFLVQRFLDRNGYRVTTCTSPDDALRCLRSAEDEFTLCITDYNMPGMSGLTLAKEIKTLRPHLPVAIASGYISDELRLLAPKAGIDELIYKPNSVEELCRTIERLIVRDAAF
ncbi:MAG: hybrid sensor histidine kinase/response regulator [Polaromonas sp.]|nr:hybrid sensor histidine kinase/response regulator [Polaromonas sp.]